MLEKFVPRYAYIKRKMKIGEVEQEDEPKEKEEED